MGSEQVFNEISSQIAESQTQSESRDQSLAPESRESSQSNNSIIDLDKVDKFKWEGKDMTREELKNAFLRHQDYTRKTQEIARERELYKAREAEQKFVDNLEADLVNVKNNPQLADQFRQLYPEKFHKYLNFVMQQQENAQPTQQRDPDFLAMKNEFSQIKEYLTEQRTAAAEAQIEATMSKLAPKYPLADPETVIVRARAAHESGVKLTPETWEEIYKSVHTNIEKLSGEFQKKRVSEQQTANKKGRDTSVGGGTPGQAPKRRSFDEATKDAIAHLSNRS